MKPDELLEILEDREAYLTSTNSILEKTWLTDLWMRVIQKAIDDLALFRRTLESDVRLTIDDWDMGTSAYCFLFDDSYRVPIDDYYIDIMCPGCDDAWVDKISEVAGKDLICPLCGCEVPWATIRYTISSDHEVRDISLGELLSIWGCEDVSGFRRGARKRVAELVESRKKDGKDNQPKKQEGNR